MLREELEKNIINCNSLNKNCDFLLEHSDCDILTEIFEENERLKDLCEELEKEHTTAFKDWTDGIKQMQKDHKYYEKAMDIIEEMIVKLKELGDTNE